MEYFGNFELFEHLSGFTWNGGAQTALRAVSQCFTGAKRTLFHGLCAPILNDFDTYFNIYILKIPNVLDVILLYSNVSREICVFMSFDKCYIISQYKFISITCFVADLSRFAVSRRKLILSLKYIRLLHFVVSYYKITSIRNLFG